MASVKKSVDRVKQEARKNAERGAKALTDSLDKAVSQTEKLRAEFEKRADEAADQTRRRTAQLALSLIDFQKTTFDNTLKIVAQIQKQSEALVNDAVKQADWMPKEGKSIVSEWQKMLNGGRTEFQKTVDSSFDLIAGYLERVREDGKKASAKKKSAAKKKASAKKKPAAKKAPAAKKKAAAKKKPAARKKAAAGS